MVAPEVVREEFEENGFSVEDTVVVVSFKDVENNSDMSSFHVFDRESGDYVLDGEGRKTVFTTLGNQAMFSEFHKDAQANPSDSGNYYFDLEKALDREVHRYEPSEISGV